ncbi:MAG TPA: aminofutalosine synthase MqnE [Candidatus Kapabacteria bacterium]|nr:aminofutalosine synthase MqnE [Candidatus Kapabacteria bacterium]
MLSSKNLTFRDSALAPIWEKVRSGNRLSKEDGIALYNTFDVIGLGRMADEVARAKSGDAVYFVLNQKFEPTNICVLSCKFCDFAVKKGAEDAYEQSIEEMLAVLNPDIREVHITMGLHPDWEWQYYVDMVRRIKENFPLIDVKAFTAVEIDFFAKKFKKTHEEVLRELKAVGLRTMPGGGAEVFSERVRKLIFNQKIGAKTWFEVHRTAHRMGINSNVTMLYGHVETIEERIEHMIKTREVQDETGGFLSFIPLAFQPGDTGIKTRNNFTSAIDDLKTIAVSRLMLDNIPHIKAYWVMLTAEVAAIALNFGADDMDGTVGHERIAHDAGATSPMLLAKEKLVSIIHEAGKVPVERDVWYNSLHIFPPKDSTVVSKMPYLNSVPFYSAYRTDSAELKLLPLVPRVFGQFAKEGLVDAGPMSLMDFVANEEEFEMMDYGVAVSGKAYSVLLYSHFDWNDLHGKRIGITAESSTSVELLRLLLEKKYAVKGVTFERLHLTSGQNDYTKFDAVLLIGDEALRRSKLGLATFLNVFDLAEEWYVWKQMPFVFAVWTVRKSVPNHLKKEIDIALSRSLNETRGKYAEVGREHAKRLGLTREDLENYLNAFTFELGVPEKEAIEEFLKEQAVLA